MIRLNSADLFVAPAELLARNIVLTVHEARCHPEVSEFQTNMARERIEAFIDTLLIGTNPSVFEENLKHLGSTIEVLAMELASTRKIVADLQGQAIKSPELGENKLANGTS